MLFPCFGKLWSEKIDSVKFFSLTAPNSMDVDLLIAAHCV